MPLAPDQQAASRQMGGKESLGRQRGRACKHCESNLRTSGEGLEELWGRGTESITRKEGASEADQGRACGTEGVRDAGAERSPQGLSVL